MTQQLKQIESLFSTQQPKGEVTMIESSLDSDCNVHGGRRDSFGSTSLKRNSVVSLATLNNGIDSVDSCGPMQYNNGVRKRESIDREMTPSRRINVVQRRRSFAGDRASSVDNVR